MRRHRGHLHLSSSSLSRGTCTRAQWCRRHAIILNLVCHAVRAQRSMLSIVNPTNLVYTAIMYFENNDFILKIIQYNWVYNIMGNLF